MTQKSKPLASQALRATALLGSGKLTLTEINVDNVISSYRFAGFYLASCTKTRLKITKTFLSKPEHPQIFKDLVNPNLQKVVFDYTLYCSPLVPEFNEYRLLLGLL